MNPSMPNHRFAHRTTARRVRVIPLVLAGRGRVNRKAHRGFSLVEIIVVVALISVIMLGLMMMFDQTQRAFRTSMTQTDVLEGGRSATELIHREMEQMTPANGNTPNFFAAILPAKPLIQPLPGTAGRERLNLLEDVFFLKRENQTWSGIGYFVRNEVADAGGKVTLRWPTEGTQQLLAGSLYRFEQEVPAAQADAPAQVYSHFLRYLINGVTNNPSETTKIADGVVDFKVRAYGTNGMWITNNLNWAITATNLDGTLYPPEVRYYQFTSNAVPAAVEFELGLLEDSVWRRYNVFLNGAARYRYLTNNVGGVHLFRQRVAVRNVDVTAYQ